MEFFHCISLNEAYELIESNLMGVDLKPEKISLLDSLGRIAAEDIFANEDLPPFNRSTVDGFAVSSQDTFGASESAPALFLVGGEVFMGEEAKMAVTLGQAVAIPTGGMLPNGLDAVVMIENTERPDKDTLLVSRPVAPLENVVARGEDVNKGQLLLGRGKLISASDIGLLAAFGLSEVSVQPKLSVGIISTGDEIVDISRTPLPGQVRDINSYALAAMLKEINCNPVCYGIIKDSYQELKETVEKAAVENNLVIISGGSSVGTRDHSVKVIEELGSRKVLFHGLSLKPGKPTILGLVKNTFVFGLPGHPMAAMIVCRQLVKRTVELILGCSQTEPFYIFAEFNRNIASAPGREDFLRVRLKWLEEKYLAEPILGKSGLIRTMAEAQGLVHVAADKTGLYAGEIVRVELL